MSDSRSDAIVLFGASGDCAKKMTFSFSNSMDPTNRMIVTYENPDGPRDWGKLTAICCGWSCLPGN